MVDCETDYWDDEMVSCETDNEMVSCETDNQQPPSSKSKLEREVGIHEKIGWIKREKDQVRTQTVVNMIFDNFLMIDWLVYSPIYDNMVEYDQIIISVSQSTISSEISLTLQISIHAWKILDSMIWDDKILWLWDKKRDNISSSHQPPSHLIHLISPSSSFKVGVEGVEIKEMIDERGITSDEDGEISNDPILSYIYHIYIIIFFSYLLYFTWGSIQTKSKFQLIISSI